MSVPVDDGSESDLPWTRLNPLMLFVHPLRELIRYLPLLLVAVVAGSVGGEQWWTYALSGFGIVIGILRWVTTTYRLTPTHVQVHSGILSRKLLSVPRDRIRSVDVDSTLLHRIFGLSVVRAGTGASHGISQLEFNALSTKDVQAFRAELLAKVRGRTALAEEEIANAEFDAAPTNYSNWNWSWVRFAPFTLSGVASIFVVAAFVLQVQFFENGLLTRIPLVKNLLAQLSHIPTGRLVGWGIVILAVVAAVVAVVRYLLTYSGFAITRADGSTLHISHGLLRKRQVTLDEKRLRGVQLSEPLSLRSLGAASAHAVMTGLGRQRGGVALLSPPGPKADALAISTEVLGTNAPLTVELRKHGRVARRRRYTRAATFAAVLAAAAAALQYFHVFGPGIWWAFVGIVPASALLAWDRYRGLGHALLPGWLVAQSGSLNRKRVALETDGIIGWTIRRSYFQRRAGLATVIATTAAGRHRYDIPDLPFGEVWPLIEEISGT
ncbi:MAG: PH domain-containing protein [Rhodoglobus sp.]